MLPKKIQFGDTIGIISPASPQEYEEIRKGVSFLKSLGFKIKKGNHIYAKLGYLAGSDEARAQDLMDMFLDKEVDMILCIRGGYGCMRILPLLDYNIIKNNPKIFMGFSDITAILNTFSSQCNLITFHGPMTTSNLNDKETLKSFLDTISKGYEPYKIYNPGNMPIQCINDGITKGKIVGGNLCLISSTLGTPYEIDTKNNILFIEDVGEKPYAIDRMLTQLYLSGKLSECSGFILGQFTDCQLPNYERSLTLMEIFKDRLLSLNKPTILNFMSGHDYPKITLPIGVTARISSCTPFIEILEPIVSA